MILGIIIGIGIAVVGITLTVFWCIRMIKEFIVGDNDRY